jgi:hypothetical protein
MAHWDSPAATVAGSIVQSISPLAIGAGCPFSRHSALMTGSGTVPVAVDSFRVAYEIVSLARERGPSSSC